MKRIGLPPTVLTLSATHLVNDIFGNIYAPLLPLLIPRLGLSLTAAGTIAMAIHLSGSVSQLFFGPLADRWRPRVLVIAGPLLAVALLSLAPLATSALMLGAILVAGNMGSAAFHPTAAAVVNRVGGDRRGLAMSVHVSGGAVGNAVAPLIFAPYAQRFGVVWTPLLALPALLLLARILRGVPEVRLAQGRGPQGLAALRPYAVPLTLLWVVVVIRTLVAIGFSTFLPVFMTRQGMSVSQAGTAVSLYLMTGSVGGLAGGPMADRFGPRRVIAFSLFAAVPLLALAPALTGPASLAVLVAGGFFLGSTLPVNITYAHMIAPVATGTVSSLMMGVAWGTGGLAVPAIGLLGDSIGLGPTLQLVGLLPAAGALLILALPAARSHPREVQPASGT